MLLYLLVLFTLYNPVWCQISCYDCSSISDAYDYIITSENIPSQLNNCPINIKQSKCHIGLRWFLSTNKTILDLIPDSLKKKVQLSEHTLAIDAVLGKNGSNQEIERSLHYFCSTDKCNSANELKRVLQSLTLSDQFMDLKDLLKPSEPFDGHWCLNFSNRTVESCNIPVVVDQNQCKQCSTIFGTEPNSNTICAGCYTDAIHQEFIGREILFNMTDRTRTEYSMITCRSPFCNSLQTGDQIRQKSTIDFDFVKFLNAGSQHSALSSFGGIILMLMVFAIKEIF